MKREKWRERKRDREGKRKIAEKQKAPKRKVIVKG